MPTPIETVTAFLADLSKGNSGLYNAIRAYFTPQTVWENVGLATTTGVEEAHALIRQFEQGGIASIAIETLAIAADGNRVLTERIDRMIKANGTEFWAPRVMGIFEIEGGKIVAWRDYFDSAGAQSHLAGG